MAISLYQVDAFTSKAYKGNPAAVVILNEAMPDEWMQSLAKEMNLSETAFLLRQPSGFHLRWFTPKAEVALCGHATLASAHVLFEKEYLDKKAMAKFVTASGMLTARFEQGWIELNFPQFKLDSIPVTDEISRALGFHPTEAFETDVNLLVEMGTPAGVEVYTPDFTALAALPFQGIILTARGTGTGFDFVSRYFAPQIGIDEDPVTGSAHCSLAPFWSQRLGKQTFLAYQVSERTGILKVRMGGGRVLLQGQAVTVFSGNLEI